MYTNYIQTTKICIGKMLRIIHVYDLYDKTAPFQAIYKMFQIAIQTIIILVTNFISENYI